MLHCISLWHWAFTNPWIGITCSTLILVHPWLTKSRDLNALSWRCMSYLSVTRIGDDWVTTLNTLQPTDFNPKDRQRNNSRKKVGDRVTVSSWKCILKMELSVWVHLHHQSPIYLPTDTHKVVVDDYLLALLPMCTCAAGKKAISPSYHHTKFTMDTAAVTVLQWRRYHRQTRQHNAGRPSGARTLEHTTFVCMCVWSWLCCILVKGCYYVYVRNGWAAKRPWFIKTYNVKPSGCNKKKCARTSVFVLL